MASQLDSNQVLPAAFDDASQTLKVTPSVGIGAAGQVVDQVIVPASSIHNSAGAKTQVIASLMGHSAELQPYDTTGSTNQIFTGPAGGTLLCTVGPGQDTSIPIQLPIGTQIWIRSFDAVAPTSGTIILLFLG